MGKVKNSLDRWLAFLSRNDLLSKDNLPEELDDIHIKKALEVMEIMSFNETERVAYEDHLKWFRDKYSVIESAKEEGLMEGIAEGFKKGIEKGEKDKTIQVAKEMLADNEPIDKIVKYMMFTKEEIERL
ncbi:MAG: PD-(D/E)XK nuclease family transposase [Rickettsia endosymbiont of Ixodes ricinus]|uniref:PD-(D/E)XK nuclease family transposase n=1 Tax=Rickettsia helvetica TaxID=35789 RepID=UPI00049492D4|nr:PD-(D/E)XK nuclease family transposase [Rickettsia helvetica]MCZ6884648.1 PD-(D/E)XK nuclease family transposase [Rickettsia endosymbiont of Ixodes ricinus]MCZ6896656.1 PD-(D/E)XK nuclease family transposase [Rickettsia endosymbiont of Ixodes ricinus]